MYFILEKIMIIENKLSFLQYLYAYTFFLFRTFGGVSPLLKKCDHIFFRVTSSLIDFTIRIKAVLGYEL